ARLVADSPPVAAALEIRRLCELPTCSHATRMLATVPLGHIPGAIILPAEWPFAHQDRCNHLLRFQWVESRAALELIGDYSQRARDELRRKQSVALDVAITEVSRLSKFKDLDPFQVQERMKPKNGRTYYRLDWPPQYKLMHKKGDGHCIGRVLISVAGPTYDEHPDMEVVWPDLPDLGQPLSGYESKSLGLPKGTKYPSCCCIVQYNRE
ncbi:unnamed protein product, partial [Prorocentrum cordatum]